MRTGSGARGREVATRVVLSRPRFRASSPSFVLAISRAVGETMIVLIAAGGQPNLSFNPGKAMQTMTAFIGAAGHRRPADREHRVQDDLRGGRPAVRATFAMNIISIRLVRKYREVYE